MAAYHDVDTSNCPFAIVDRFTVSSEMIEPRHSDVDILAVRCDVQKSGAGSLLAFVSRSTEPALRFEIVSMISMLFPARSALRLIRQPHFLA